MVKKKTIEDCRKVAQERGGECLSEEYVNARSKIKWRCKEGHEWEAIPDSVGRAGSWCRKCGHISTGKQSRLKNGLELAKQYAQAHKGYCLSTEYINGITDMQWKCKQGHIWSSKFTSMKSHNSWCNKCSFSIISEKQRDKTGLQKCINMAKKWGGKCLSTEYTSMDKKLTFECKYNHQWNAIPYTIYKGHWCPHCAIDTQSERSKLENGLELAQDYAKKRGGDCLSENYKTARIPLEWVCKLGHSWKATYDNVTKKNSWCPSCLYKNEQQCREIIEELLQVKFPKAHPKFLHTDKKKSYLELDGYNEDLNIAFEYDGQFHYKPHWSALNDESLQSQKKRDELKDKLCRENGVLLIRIPYDTEDKEKFIRDYFFPSTQ